MPMPEYLLLTGNCDTIKAGKLEPKSATDINMQPCPSTAPHTVRVEIYDSTNQDINGKQKKLSGVVNCLLKYYCKASV